MREREGRRGPRPERRPEPRESFGLIGVIICVTWFCDAREAHARCTDPEGVPGAEVMANAGPSGGLELAENYWVSFPDGYRAHQTRLEGGDCSTDSFCYPSA